MSVLEVFIEIEPIRSTHWRVRVMPIGGHPRQADVSPLTVPALKQFTSWNDVLHGLAPTAAYQLTGQDLRSLGEGIWSGILGGSGLAAYLHEQLQVAAKEQRTVRYVLKLDEANDLTLASLPAELARACEPEWGGRFEWRRGDAPAVRVVSELEAPPVHIERGARVVIATACDPANPQPTKADLQAHSLAIEQIAKDAGFDAEVVAQATPQTLEAAIARGCDMLYIVAHGSPDPDTFGVLSLVGKELPGTELKQLLEERREGSQPCLAVILCACSTAANQPGVRSETTGMAQELSKRAVRAAIGFRAPVGVEWALAFMERLFLQLQANGDLETAFARARSLVPEHDPQWPLAAFYGRPLKEQPTAAIVPSAPDKPAICNILPDAPRRYFTARQPELDHLLAVTAVPGSAVIHALEGEGGIGKTELARMVAHRLAAQRPVIWLDRPDQNPRASWAKVLSAVPGVHPDTLRDKDDAGFAAYVRERLAGAGGLLVLDDISKPEPAEFLLPGSNWNALITTRVDGLLPGATKVELKHLELADARKLFCRVAFREDAPPSEHAAYVDALVEHLGGLPLALELAGESVSLGTPVAEYLAVLDADHGPAWADSARIQATLARTLADVGEDDRAAFEALGILPICGAESQTVGLVLGWPEGRAARALDRLVRHRAARRRPESGRCELHPRLRDEARSRVRSEPHKWDFLHSRLAYALWTQVTYAHQTYWRDPVLAMARWAPLRGLVEGLELEAWRNGAPGAREIVNLLAYGAADFRDRELSSGQRLVAHDAALKLARALVASGDAAYLGAEYSALCNRLGDTYVALGDGKAALDAYNEGLSIRRKRVALAPSSADALRDLSISLNKLGDHFLRSGDGKAALDAHSESLGIRRKLVELDPGSAEALRDLSVSLDKLGDLFLRSGGGQAALDAYNESLGISRKLVALDPGSAQALRDLSVSLDRLGDFFLRSGDGKATLDAYNESLRISRSLVALDPDSAQAIRDLSISLDRIGDLFLRSGDGKAALDAYSEGLGFRRQLVALDPGSAEAVRDLAASLDRIGDHFLRSGDGKAAHEAHAEGLSIRRNLVALDPGSAQALRDLSVSLNRRGDLFLRSGDGKAALAAYSESLDIRRRLVALDPGSAEALRDLSASLDRLGDLLQRSGDGKAALDAYNEGLGISRRLVALDPGSAQALRDLSVSLGQLGGVFLRNGDRKAALAAGNESLSISRKLVALDLGSAHALRDLSLCLNKLGDIYLGDGDGKAALAAYNESLGIRRKLVALDPGSAESLRDLSISLNKLGDLFLRNGDSKAAFDANNEGLDISRKLVALDSGSAQALRDLSISLVKLGDHFLRSGDGKAARDAYNEALGISRKLLALDPGNAEALRDLSISLDKLGGLHVRSTDGRAALGPYKGSLGVARKLVALDPGNAEFLRDLSISLNKLGDLFLRLGDGRAALEVYRESLDVTRKWVADGSGKKEALRDLAASLQRVGAAILGTGNPAESLGTLEEASDLRQRALAQDPEAVGLQRERAGVLSLLASARRASGDATGAIASLREAVTLARTIHGRFPSDADIRNLLRTLLVELAETLESQRDIAEAESLRAEATPLGVD